LRANLAMVWKGEATDQPCTPLWTKDRIASEGRHSRI
jgi:hypothetical protein